MVVIPVQTLPAWTENITLGDWVGRISFQWNTRSEAWTVDFSDSLGNPLLLGVKLVTGWELLHQFPREELPQGAILVVSLDGSDADPGRNDLGARISLVYLSPDEL